MARSARRQVVAPYVTLDQYISKVRYRHSMAAKFQDVDASPKALYVPVDDLRSIPRHELSVSLDSASLPKIYAKHLEKLLLVVLTRDNVLKKEQVLYRTPVATLPETFVLDPEKLKQTASRNDLPLEINICAVALNGAAAGWPTRRASRLAAWYLNLSNHSKGPRFPWIRKTAEEFRAKGLPMTSSFYVDLLGSADELVSNGDATIEELLEVWVHEDVWVVLQQSDASLGISAIQRLFVSHVASQILDLVTEPLAKGAKFAERSIGQLLLEYVAEQSKANAADLESTLRTRKSTIDLAPYITAAFGVNKALKRVISE
jgi:hypothetical protein